MIVLILAGGLGNQMFEYAAGKAMALRSGTDLVVNNRLGFERDKVYNRVYSLGNYNVSYKKQKLLTFDFPGGFIFSKISAKLGRHVLCPWYRYVSDNKITTQDLKEHPKRYKNVIMSGTFVFPEFFDDHKETILDEFTLKESIELPLEARACLEKIEKSPVPVVALCARIYQEIKNPGDKDPAIKSADATFAAVIPVAAVTVDMVREPTPPVRSCISPLRFSILSVRVSILLRRVSTISEQ